MTSLLVLTDIWGDRAQVANWLSPIVAAIPGLNDVQVISPYRSDFCHPATEQQAYQRFQQAGGLPSYIAKAQVTLTPQSLVIGFSAGGAAAFALAASNEPPAAVFAVYGGQIHRMADLQIRCPTELLFSNEGHFDVAALMAVLQQQPMIHAEHWPLTHGFANPHSTAYDAKAQQLLACRLSHWLAEKTKGA
ncbi:MAG TPA: hypothetical protein DCS87_15725 [Rheinheimera sp.]|nr:hypothetical protein [Rheinheimera sp.]